MSTTFRPVSLYTFGHVDGLLYPCLQYYKGGNCSSQICNLLELLETESEKQAPTGEYGKDRGYGKTAMTCIRYKCCLKLKFSLNVTSRCNTEAVGV